MHLFHYSWIFCGYFCGIKLGPKNKVIKLCVSNTKDCNQGTAEVVFSRKSDGVAALKRYNNVQLDGKAMKIEPIGANLTTSAVPPATSAVAVDAGALLGVTNGVTGDRIFKNRGVFGWFNPTPRRMLGVKYDSYLCSAQHVQLQALRLFEQMETLYMSTS